MYLTVLAVIAGCAPDDDVALDPPADTDQDCVGCLAVPADDAEILVAQVRAADGAIWASWVESRGAGDATMRVARSPAPGVVEEAIAVPLAEAPVVSSTERPSFAVRGDRIAFASTGYGVQRHADAHAVYVQLGTIRPDGITFDDPLLLDEGGGTAMVMEHARVEIGLDGEVWVLWKRQDWGVTDRPTMARESEGFVPVEAAEGLPRDHECSPPDLRIGATSGRPLLALRGNLEGWLETLVLAGDEGGLGAATRVSDDQTRSVSDICPEHGPRIVELPDGTQVVTWISPDLQGAAASTAASSDGGVTWTAPVADHTGGDGVERWLSLAVRGDGWLSAVEQADGTLLALHASASDLETAPVAAPLLTADGEPLWSVEVAATGDRAVAVGLDSLGRLRLVEIE